MIGELDTIGTGLWRLRFTRQLTHPADKVWRAITKPDHLAAAVASRTCWANDHWWPSGSCTP
jgi:uncharacterized protein YndB with AHSA1/START domain